MCKLIVALALGASFMSAWCWSADVAPEANFVVNRIRFFPRAGQASHMTGGRFTGSLTSATNDFETIADVKQVPAEGKWTVYELPRAAKAYRFVKFESPDNGYGDVAEIEFYHGDHKLTGKPFGTIGDNANANNKPELAFDGDTQTFFSGDANRQYVGLDLGDASQVAAPTVSVPSGQYATAQMIELTSATPGAVIQYTLNGDRKAYTGPIKVEKSGVLSASATKPGLADSVQSLAAYRIGASAVDAKATSSFHIGNSLTDTVNAWMEPLAKSAGHDLRYYRFTIPGAPTDWLWTHPGGGFGESHYEQSFIARAPIGNLITQPFAGHGRSIANEAEFSGKFWDMCRQSSPDVQMWLYCQWPSPKFDDGWSKGSAGIKDAGWPPPQVKIGEPAKTWQEAVQNHLRYTEKVRDEMNKQHEQLIKQGKAKPVLIIPGGLALAKLKTLIDAGKVLGEKDLFKDNFADDIHLNSKGAYLVSMVHYACIFKESPEGKVTAANTGLTDEQAKLYQKLAWETVQEYPLDGVGGK